MRLISFSLTTEQVRDRSKTVTRRLGWANLKPGDLLCAVEKARGLKPGEKVKRLATIKVESVRQEPLNEIYYNDVKREGFHGMSVDEFISMFCREMKCRPETLVNRIEFSYVD